MSLQKLTYNSKKIILPPSGWKWDDGGRGLQVRFLSALLRSKGVNRLLKLSGNTAVM